MLSDIYGCGGKCNCLLFWCYLAVLPFNLPFLDLVSCYFKVKKNTKVALEQQTNPCDSECWGVGFLKKSWRGDYREFRKSERSLDELRWSGKVEYTPPFLSLFQASRNSMQTFQPKKGGGLGVGFAASCTFGGCRFWCAGETSLHGRRGCQPPQRHFGAHSPEALGPKPAREPLLFHRRTVLPRFTPGIRVAGGKEGDPHPPDGVPHPPMSPATQPMRARMLTSRAPGTRTPLSPAGRTTKPSMPRPALINESLFKCAPSLGPRPISCQGAW